MNIQLPPPPPSSPLPPSSSSSSSSSPLPLSPLPLPPPSPIFHHHQGQKKKAVEFHFVDMNDPERYKKLKVARACDFCRRRKSKCDIGIPGSGTCSNCQKHQMVCIFSPVTTTTTTPIQTPTSNCFPHLVHTPTTLLARSTTITNNMLIQFPFLMIQDGQVGYELHTTNTLTTTTAPPTPPPTTITQLQQELSAVLETKLFQLYFQHIHPAYPLLLKTSIMNIHVQDRLLLSTSLRYIIMALTCHYYPSEYYKTADYFFNIAQATLNLTSIRLDTVQSLLLLYKYQEIQGHQNCIWYLEKAQDMMGQLTTPSISQQQEMINRAKWILFGCIACSNLSLPSFLKLYKMVDLPIELPQPLKDEQEDVALVNQFAQIANLSVLYSHTVISLMEHNANLIDLQQFKEIRHHWHQSLHPMTQSRLQHCANNDIDMLILVNAVLYDMLYLLLLSHYNKQDEGMETSFRLQKMVHTWTTRHCFTVSVQSKRMACFALMLCLQHATSTEFIRQIYDTIQLIQYDTRIENELNALIITSSATPVMVDYFSLIPQQPPTTPGLWSSDDHLTTPIQGDLNNKTVTTTTTTTTPHITMTNHNTIHEEEGYFSPPSTIIHNTYNITSMEQLNTSTNYLKLDSSPSSSSSNHQEFVFTLQHPHYPPSISHVQEEIIKAPFYI